MHLRRHCNNSKSCAFDLLFAKTRKPEAVFDLLWDDPTKWTTALHFHLAAFQLHLDASFLLPLAAGRRLR